MKQILKLFPGIRWNIGKRSSSLSIAGLGAHFTGGTSGSRATVSITAATTAGGGLGNSRKWGCGTIVLYLFLGWVLLKVVENWPNRSNPC
jgi:hypothetical protein